MLLVQAAFEKGARVNARRGVRLEKHQIAALRGIWAAKEMIEADLKNLRGGCVACDVAAELSVGLVGAHDHGERVPAHDRRDALLERDITRVPRLSGGG